MRVLLTRPAGLNDNLGQLLLAGGIEVLIRPMVRLESVEASPLLKSRAMDLDQFDKIVFVSKSAVRFGMPLFDRYWPQWPEQLTWFAVGPGTGAELATLDIKALSPASPGSEGLLALAELQQVLDQKIMIVRGSGGRELLATSLCERGAIVEYFECYNRVPVVYDTWDESFDVVVATSVEILENLIKQLDSDRLSSLKVIAGSSRIADASKSLGFGQVTNAAGASDQALYDAVLALID